MDEQEFTTQIEEQQELSKLETKLDFNLKAVGKPVIVIDGVRQWTGEIIKVKDEETFVVKHPKLNIEFEVSIFNVRYI